MRAPVERDEVLGAEGELDLKDGAGLAVLVLGAVVACLLYTSRCV